MDVVLLQVIAQTTVQALGTAVGVMILAFLGSLGLVSIKSASWRATIEGLFTLPSFLPSLFVIVAVLGLFDLLGLSFPFGITGIVIMNVFFMSGFVAVALARQLDSILAGPAEWAWISGASRRLFWQAALGMISHRLWLLFLYVFVAAFSSFAIPFIVGGSQGETVDVHIYRLAFGGGQWGAAILIALSQMIFLFALSLLIGQGGELPVSSRRFRGELGWTWGIVPLMVCVATLFAGSWPGLIDGLSALLSDQRLIVRVLINLKGTLIQTLSAAFMFLVLFAICLWFWPNGKLLRVLRGFVSPSTVFCGLLFYWLWPEFLRSSDLALVWVGGGFTLLIFASLYRVKGEATLRSLESQIQAAWLMGAKRGEIFLRVLWPQALPDALWMAGLVALWTSGDFAFSFIVLERERTLGIMAQTLLGGYRLELAGATVWILLFVGLIFFYTFSGLSHVARKKLVS